MSLHRRRTSHVIPVVARALVTATFGIVLLGLPEAPASAQVTQQQLYLTVLGDDDEPISDLRSEEVRVTENGTPGEVLYLRRPADVTILVDTGAAVVPATTQLRQALETFVDELAGYARMSTHNLRRHPGSACPANNTRISSAGGNRCALSLS